MTPPKNEASLWNRLQAPITAYKNFATAHPQILESILITIGIMGVGVFFWWMKSSINRTSFQNRLNLLGRTWQNYAKHHPRRCEAFLLVTGSVILGILTEQENHGKYFFATHLTPSLGLLGLFGLVCLLALYLYLTAALALTYAPVSRFGGRWFELLFHMLLALVSGGLIVAVIQETGKFNATDYLSESVVVGTVLFAVSIIGKAAEAVETVSGRMEKLEAIIESADELKNAASISVQAVTEARFSGLAARVLGVREEALQLETSPIGRQSPAYDPGIVDGVEQGVEALRAWILSGGKTGREFPGDDDFEISVLVPSPREDHRTWANTARQAWWRAMKVYQKEEVYDISALELATNIRNYAFILLAVISEFLHGVKQQNRAFHEVVKKVNRKRKKESAAALDALGKGYRLVVANVSGFAPKDFYNYPDGAKGSRFYHEAEFFGTYRRALARVVADPNVCALRVVLAAPNPVIPNAKPGDEEVREPRPPDSRNKLGWALDPLERLILDCARLRVVPWPITDDTKGQAGESDFPRGISKVPSREDVGLNFPPERNPALRLPERIGRYLWDPTFANLNSFQRWRESNEHDACSGAELAKFRDDWLSRAALFEPSINAEVREIIQKPAPTTTSSPIQFSKEAAANLRLRRFLRTLPEIALMYLDQSGEQKLKKHKEKAFDEMWQAFCKVCSPLHAPTAMLTSVSNEVRKKLSEKTLSFDTLTGEVDRMLATQQTWNDVEGRQNSARCLASILRAEWWERYLTDASRRQGPPELPSRTAGELTDILLSFVEDCQKIDALLKLLTLKSDGNECSPSTRFASTGVQLGWGENWLHRSLVHHEAVNRRDQVKKEGPVPLWHLLMTDLCGVTKDAASDGKPLDEKLQKQLLEHFRVCVIHEDIKSEGVNGTVSVPDSVATAFTEAEMLKQNILPEFLMVGVEFRDICAGPSPRTDRSAEVANSGDDSIDITKVKWLALVGAEMSEPLHTCRVQVRFDHDQDCKENVCIKRHAEWLRTVWKDSEEKTRYFLKRVAEEDLDASKEGPTGK
jgi:hypothetical protein